MTVHTNFLFGVLLLLLCSLASADSAPALSSGEAQSMSVSVSPRLLELEEAVQGRKTQLDQLTRQVQNTTDSKIKATLEQQIKEETERLNRLRASIEQILIGGIDTSALGDQATGSIDWRAELESISRPLLSSLRELTAKPRRIENLRAQITDGEQKLKVIIRALSSIDKYEAAELPKPVRERVAQIAAEWRARQTEVSQNVEVARLQLDDLSGQTTSFWAELKLGLKSFAQGRGLTLVLAVGVGFLTWLVLRGLLILYEKTVPKRGDRTRTTRLRVVEYAYRAATFLLILGSVITVFYLRNDLLLMALSLAAVFALLLALRQIIPQYMRETRLLLDIGPVREGERVNVDGVPYKVVVLNVNSILKNPRLDGLLRLPLAVIDSMVSRPDRDEPWFPTRAGDYLLLSDGRLAQVVSQSVEFVKLKVAESSVVWSTGDFLQQNLRNLSAEGYGLAVTFGIDYEHQDIALEQPAAVFKQSVASTIEAAGLQDHIKEISVEFKEAASNSLDYLILLSVAKTGGGAYNKLGRLVQQACVRACNEQQWGIPFSQLTVHPGTDLESLAQSVVAGNVGRKA